MPSSIEEKVWLFEFALEAEDGSPIHAGVPEDLMDAVVAWAETRGLQIGGGFRAPTPRDFLDDPVFSGVEPES